VASTQHTAFAKPPVVYSDRLPLDDEIRPLPLHDDEQMRARIYEHIADLGNTVLYKRAYGELRKIKSASPRALSSPTVFRRVMAMLEWGHYRLAARKLVRDLFEPSVLKSVILKGISDSVSQVRAVGPSRANVQTIVSTEESKSLENDRAHGQVPQRRMTMSSEDNDNSDYDDDYDDDEIVSSSDEATTERQRSISDPSDLHPQSGPFKIPGTLRGYASDAAGSMVA